jgi:ATP-dependent helicase/nuclease subunit A
MGEVISIRSGRDGDEAARERIRTSLDESLLVEAAAGTGKTTELINRVVAVLSGGRGKVENLVAVTFTRKAAGELKLRLRQELDRALGAARARVEAAEEGSAAGAAAGQEGLRLEHAIAHLEEARIGTIHSFCADLLRERPVEAEVDPAFQEISEPEEKRLLRRAFRKWLEAELKEGSAILRRSFERGRRGDQGATESLYQAGIDYKDFRDFNRPWQRRAFPRQERIDWLLERVEKLADLSQSPANRQDALFESLLGVRELAERLRRERKEGVRRDDDRWEGLLVRLAEQLGRNRKKGRGPYAQDVLREDVLRQREALLEDLRRFAADSGADLAALLQAEMRKLVDAYDRLKRAAGALDFVDLLLLARNLVRGNAAVRRYLQQKFTHIFVDEFQDTDPLQAEVLLLLAADNPEETDWRQARPAPGKLFLVGDPKQSIYRFRRADVMLYQELRDRLRERGVALVHLTHSFRAPRPLQEAINQAYAPAMQQNRLSGQPGYVRLEGNREPIAGQPYLVALPVPEPYGGREHAGPRAIEASLPEAVGGFVNWLLHESGWKVRKPDSGSSEELVPIEPSHIAILFRRFTSWGRDVTREYRRALEAREIMHLVVGATAIHTREEMETLRAALAAIEWPEDELSVFATLKGSIFALPDSALLRYRQLARTLHPFRRRPERLEKDLEPVAQALDALAGLHRRRNGRAVVETLQELLESTRAHAGFALRPAGHQALANVYRLCDEARNFEARGGISFRAFIEELESQAEREERSESLVFEEGAEGVRLITVHKAKGLEFPVVILADLTAKLAREASRYTDREQGLCAQRLAGCEPWDLLEHQGEETARDGAEGIRVAYVAATRARDLLVVTTVGESPYQGGWLEPLNRSLYPDPERARHSRPAPGCPPFGRLPRSPATRTTSCSPG